MNGAKVYVSTYSNNFGNEQTNRIYYLFIRFKSLMFSFRLPYHVTFILSIIIGAYVVARKFKKVNPTTSYSLFHIFFIFSFVFLASCLVALVYVYLIIKYFNETEGKVKKAIIAGLTPGLFFPVTGIAKYLALRKSSKIIPPDRTFVLCYFLRGAPIVLYRTMQADFENISKATLNLRIKMWKFFIKCVNNFCCGPKLEVRGLNSPRIRRLNADLEIQNILFEYTTAILSQAYLACYLVTSFDISPWTVIKSSLTRIGISLASDFIFNMISVFIQIHYYDIPMRKVWLKYWFRHVTANALIIICMVAYFGPSLVSVFASYKNTFKEYKLRNCTTIF